VYPETPAEVLVAGTTATTVVEALIALRVAPIELIDDTSTEAWDARLLLALKKLLTAVPVVIDALASEEPTLATEEDAASRLEDIAEAMLAELAPDMDAMLAVEPRTEVAVVTGTATAVVMLGVPNIVGVPVPGI